MIKSKPFILGDLGRHQLDGDQIFITNGTTILRLPSENKLEIINNENKDLTVVDCDGDLVCTVPPHSMIVLKSQYKIYKA